MILSGGSGSGGSFSPAITTVTFAISGASGCSGSITLTTSAQNGSFTDFAFARGAISQDPYISHLLNQNVDVSQSSSFVRLWTTATAPINFEPYAPQSTVAGRAAYGGVNVQEVNMKASGTAFIDHVQFEQAPSQTLLTAAAEGYETGMLYALEPGVGALWEQSQAHTFTGQYAGHFLASPAYTGNTYQKVASTYQSYTQLLNANQTYADVLNGPS